MQQHDSKYFAQGGGVKRSNYIFFEISHVAYQIKADEAGSNMVANNLPTDAPLTVRSKYICFLKVVMLHIKLKGIEHRAP